MSLMVSQPKIDISSPVKPTAAFDPPVVAPGQQAIYRVTFNALEETHRLAGQDCRAGRTGNEPRRAWRDSADGAGQLPAAHGLQLSGPPLQPRHVQRARVHRQRLWQAGDGARRAPGGGCLAPPARHSRRRESCWNCRRPTSLSARPSGRACSLPGSLGGAVQGLAQVQLSGHGFLVDLGGARQRIEVAAASAAARMPTYVYEATLTPMVEGKITVFAQGFVAGSHFSGPIVITGGRHHPGRAAPIHTGRDGPGRAARAAAAAGGRVAWIHRGNRQLRAGGAQAGDERRARRRRRHARRHCHEPR